MRGQNGQIKIQSFKEAIGKNEQQFLEEIKLYNYKTLWTYVVNGILAIWLISQPFLLDYKSSALMKSDIISGVIVILVEIIAFIPRFALIRWGTAVVAFWLLLAPLIFWSPTPTTYLVDTLMACLFIAFAVLIPGLPGRAGIQLPGPDKPPGWSYNPSSWIRRWLGIALALVGFFLARYLAAHQLGYIPHLWDPFFGDGSDKVTGSALSKSFPISDAGFGAVAYVLEVLTGFMGGRARWRTAPFIAVTFAVLVIPLGATSILLVIMQPVVVGAWCGFCLVSAFALLISVPLAVHESIAVGQFLVLTYKQKKNFWQMFWLGGNVLGYEGKDPDRTCWSFRQRWAGSVQGVSLPWFIIVQAIIGVWLMARPSILPFNIESANCDHWMGAIIVTVAAVTAAEVTRTARFVNVVAGVVAIILTLVFSSGSTAILLCGIVSAVLLIIVSIPKGVIVERYASW
ncbi:MAG: vitamin K epoxide reductase family protein, partial [Verrucomicrobia bacterium]|nr:vitamin K epoxide reductase family protein [Verrucomicrobiota bacterium]